MKHQRYTRKGLKCEALNTVPINMSVILRRAHWYTGTVSYPTLLLSSIQHTSEIAALLITYEAFTGVGNFKIILNTVPIQQLGSNPEHQLRRHKNMSAPHPFYNGIAAQNSTDMKQLLCQS
jgi:hypothetical protein